MARFTGPKGKVNRRLGVVVYDTEGAIGAIRKRPHPPGEHPWRRGKPSMHGLALKEKQKLKHYYGLQERQLRRFMDLARAAPGDTGATLLALLERRLDNVVWRAGLCTTRTQARQAVAHGHVSISGVKARCRSQLVAVGEQITVRERLKPMFTKNTESTGDRDGGFVKLDKTTLTATMDRLPTTQDVLLEVDVRQVVELLSK